MRSSGILLPVSSLPSPYGIGSIGSATFAFVDFLQAAGQQYWQVLPLGPTGYGDSPYQSFSAFAGNPYFIDLPQLAAEGLLTEAELASARDLRDPQRVDYGALFERRFAILAAAVDRVDPEMPELADFFAENADWLEDYALFHGNQGGARAAEPAEMAARPADAGGEGDASCPPPPAKAGLVLENGPVFLLQPVEEAEKLCKPEGNPDYRRSPDLRLSGLCGSLGEQCDVPAG